MAKLTAPLLSFGARGKLADTLVYFPWKGIAAVRSYVIPANPNTGPQQTQRGFFGNAVENWHSQPLSADDKLAWNRLASTLATPMSGFNAYCRFMINTEVRGDTPILIDNGTGTDTGGGAVDVQVLDNGTSPATMNVYWGYSPSSLINSSPMVETVGTWDVTINPAVNSRIYFQFRGLDATPDIVAQTGIYLLAVGP
jgi:hypothetical protein